MAVCPLIGVWLSPEPTVAPDRPLILTARKLPPGQQLHNALPPMRPNQLIYIVGCKRAAPDYQSDIP